MHFEVKFLMNFFLVFASACTVDVTASVSWCTVDGGGY